MKYAIQTQAALDRLDQALLALNKMIKAGKQQEAIEFMEQGPLKDRFDELQNIINISQTNNMGSRGVENIRPL
tara:strand:+ start:329 stop:547 length:219 start_codon:yes stop_codon:yes gene_type:complete